jgi:hypothetical protein
MQIEFVIQERQLVAIVTLSKRNLLALLEKLSCDDSIRMIRRRCENGVWLVLKAEPDDEHYRFRPAGQMHPRTEAAIERSAPKTPHSPNPNNGEKH